MNDRDLVTRLLGTRGEDAGCEGALALLGEYAQGELERRNVRELLPAVAEPCAIAPAARRTTKA
jgi:hypothetical protein